MKFIEDRLEGLDNFFQHKKESEKWLIIVAIVAIITYLSYIFLLPYAKNLYNQSKTKKDNLQKKIISNKKYLSSITVGGDRDYYVKKYTQDIRNKKVHISKLKSDILVINKNLDLLSDMLFNKKSWSNFINTITSKAAYHNVDIQEFTNSYIDSKGSFGHVLEIGIECQGSYKDIVKFMNEIEQNVLVTDIYGSNMKMDKNSTLLLTDINISVWGINH